MILKGDAEKVLAGLEPASVQCMVTSPPYYMQRDYGFEGQIGLEPTPEEYVERLRAVFAEARRVLRPDGTLWLNLGDTYNAYNGNRGEGGVLNRGVRHEMLPKQPTGYGLTDKAKPNKCLLGMPGRVADALSRDGWVLRSEIIWHKPNGRPGGGRDRPASRHEFVFLFANRGRGYWVADEVRLWGDVWTIPVGGRRRPREHSAMMADDLASRCVRGGSRPGDVVLDMFHGSGTTELAAVALGRSYVGIDAHPDTAESP